MISSGNGNDGALVNGPTWTTLGSGEKVLSFDGVDDYVDCGNDSSLSVIDIITFATWIKRKGKGPHSTVDAIFGKGLSSSYGAYFYSSDNKPFLRIYNSTENLCANSSITLDIWQYWVFAYDGSDMKIYLNGVQDRSKAFTGSIGTNSSPFQIAKIGDREDYYFNGLIDEVKIYNRILSTDEIAQIYNSTKNKYQ